MGLQLHHWERYMGGLRARRSTVRQEVDMEALNRTPDSRPRRPSLPWIGRTAAAWPAGGRP